MKKAEGFKLLFRYGKDNLKWLFMMMLIGAIMVVLMLLNGLEVQEIFYGIGLWTILFLITAGVDFFRTCQKYQGLRELENGIAISLGDLGKAGENTILEDEYQRLLQILMEEKIKEKNEIDQRNCEAKEYYTMWVHQIKTPIAALRLLLQEKSGQMDLSEEQRELFLVEQYVEMALQYLRLDATENDLLIRKVPLDHMIREAIHKYARFFIQKKIRLVYEGTEEIVLTDEKWLEFVIEQILSNAVKYTMEGSITISLQQKKMLLGNGQAEMEEGETLKEYPVLVIEDTGIGIAREDLPRIMEKGYTGYNGHVNKTSTGIGLYMCRKILKKLGHEFVITSDPGVGTRVMIGFCSRETETF